ncbi:hypothetical protein R50072_07480 [Simiduia litorea]|uniref:chaperone modulator CbpM n=1 Tax=Simiduia litorea TaxID=1435348 RepID=UPI0036F1B603
MSHQDTVVVEWFDEQQPLTLSEVCQAANASAEFLQALIDHGVIEPQGQAPKHWRFTSISINKVKRANRLQQDLGVNIAGAALALELLDQITELKQELALLKAKGSAEHHNP